MDQNQVSLTSFRHLREEAFGGGIDLVPVPGLDDLPLELNFVLAGEGVESSLVLGGDDNVLPRLDGVGQRADELCRGVGFFAGAGQAGDEEQQEGLHLDEAQGCMVATLTSCPPI